MNHFKLECSSCSLDATARRLIESRGGIATFLGPPADLEPYAGFCQSRDQTIFRSEIAEAVSVRASYRSAL
jgi:hypothetical protein